MSCEIGKCTEWFQLQFAWKINRTGVLELTIRVRYLFAICHVFLTFSKPWMTSRWPTASLTHLCVVTDIIRLCCVRCLDIHKSNYICGFFQNEVPQQIYNIFSNSWNLYYPPISCIKKTIVWTKTGLIYVYSPLSLSYYPKIRDKFYSISKRNVIKRIFLISKFMTAATIQSYISLWKSHHGQHCSLKSDESKVTAWREIQWKTDTEYCSKFCK